MSETAGDGAGVGAGVCPRRRRSWRRCRCRRPGQGKGVHGDLGTRRDPGVFAHTGGSASPMVLHTHTHYGKSVIRGNWLMILVARVVLTCLLHKRKTALSHRAQSCLRPFTADPSNTAKLANDHLLETRYSERHKNTMQKGHKNTVQKGSDVDDDAHCDVENRRLSKSLRPRQ